MDPLPYYLFMSLPPLLAAFVIQFFVSPLKRRRVIIGTALGWTALVVLMTTVSSDGGNPFQAIVSVMIVLAVGFALALIGALIGSELSTLLGRLFRKSGRAQ